MIHRSVGMTTAFTLGATAFRETISNIILGSLAIPTLILGVVLILSCQQVAQTSTNTSSSVDNATFTALSNIHTMEDGEEEETIYLSTDPDRGKQIEIEMAIQIEHYDKYNDHTLSSTKSEKKKVGFVISDDNSDGDIHGPVRLTADKDREGNSLQEDRKSIYL